ncbi:hypothetical protein PYW07_011916 [Mythimna separata]|uniref:Glycosyltransferase 2-like domain-containing protein n=1 Tax=Mythimna separata TaxID=271217 RepID=A0AAD7Y776_MYTSE|nr:hypothetical protein PYW07_011916 [Mythimna separata]
MIFLDSHCEALHDWLRPLLHRIKEDKKHVVTPFIDLIMTADLSYLSPDVTELLDIILTSSPHQLRTGLIRARLQGIKTASGDVIVILDMHCETFPDWLRPLLQRIKEKADAVVIPDIDTIQNSDLRLEDTSENDEVDAMIQLKSTCNRKLRVDVSDVLDVIPKLLGLIRARQEGIRVATGDVALFLDTQCEVVPDWLRPLLQRLKDKPDAVVTPDIVNILTNDLMLEAGSSLEVAVMLRLFSLLTQLWISDNTSNTHLAIKHDP